MRVERVVGRVRAAAGEHAEVRGAGDAGVGQRAPRAQSGHGVVAARAWCHAAVLWKRNKRNNTFFEILNTTFCVEKLNIVDWLYFLKFIFLVISVTISLPNN